MIQASVMQQPVFMTKFSTPKLNPKLKGVVYQSRSWSRKFLWGVKVEVEKRIFPDLGVRVRVEKYMLDCRLPMLNKNMIKM